MKKEKEKDIMNENGEKKKHPMLAFLILAVIVALECAVIVKVVG